MAQHGSSKPRSRKIDLVLGAAGPALAAAADKLLWHLKVSGLDADDLQQIAVIKANALLEKLEAEDPAGFAETSIDDHRKTVLRFGWRVMKGAVIDHIRRADVRNNPAALATLPDQCDTAQARAMEARQEIDDLAKSLDGKKREIILAAIEIGEFDVKEIAARAHISEKYTYRLWAEIREEHNRPGVR